MSAVTTTILFSAVYQVMYGIKCNVKADRLVCDIPTSTTQTILLPSADALSILWNSICTKWQAVWDYNPHNKLFHNISQVLSISTITSITHQERPFVLNRLFLLVIPTERIYLLTMNHLQTVTTVDLH